MSDPRSEASTEGTLIYGAGSRALLYLKRRTHATGQGPKPTKILGFIDDDIGLRRRKVHGYTVHGRWEEFSAVVEELKPSELACPP